MNIWCMDNEGTLYQETNSVMIYIEEMIQRFKILKHEMKFDYENGVDYIAVFEKKAFLIPQLEIIAEEYARYFLTDFEITETTDERITIRVTVTLEDRQVIKDVSYSLK